MERFLLHQREIYGDEEFLKPLAAPEPAPKPPEDLAGFEKTAQHCRKCELSRTRKHFVFGTGNPGARLMLIGEAPGEEEDLQGKPFVGKAGQLLDKILEAIGFDRKEVYIANVLKCRPPRNRDPLPEEMALCRPLLMNQIDLIRPRIILLLGRIAAHAVLRTTVSLTQMRGRVHRFGDIPVLVTFHPAALLRNPLWKHDTWEDVQKLRNLYDQTVGDKSPWTPKKKS
jgi:uracil-DNA glycosylase